MKRRAPELKGVNLLELTPVRLARWDEAEGRVVVLRPRPRRGGLAGLLPRLLWTLSSQRIRLDAVGSFAWQRLDGRTTVAEIARATREHFGDQAEPVEGRLGTFVRQLRGEGFLAYPGVDEFQDDEIVGERWVNGGQA